jgi:phosphate starvation-inducible PhoH-like protein
MEQLLLPEEGLLHIFGINNNNLRYLEKKQNVRINSRGNQVSIDGPEENVILVKKLLTGLAELLKAGHSLRDGDIKVAMKLLEKDTEINLKDFFLDCRLQTSEHKIITPMSFNQSLYIKAMLANDAVFGIGPAGTGKTYLAAAAAVAALRKNEVKRIVLARPAIEAGEKLGFLPGDMAAKVDPFLRPIYDALYDLMNPDKVGKAIESGIIEIAPLAFMRGRNLKNSFIILDEAQNTTIPQMKMFLTRMGNGSKAVINGDITQIDLPKEKRSGLVHVITILKDIDGLEFVYFDRSDVVRHPLVERIILAYEAEKDKKKDR